MSILKKNVPLWQVLLAVAIVLAVVTIVACQDQTQASTQNAQTAAGKWGASPNIQNFYEYLQLKQIYEERDNPKLVLNAYLFSDMTGQLTCLGKVKGFGVPYGTQWSQPQNGSSGSVPEPNGLYPSQTTNADWVRLIDPKTGKESIAFIEPNLIITSQELPCKPLSA